MCEQATCRTLYKRESVEYANHPGSDYAPVYQLVRVELRYWSGEYDSHYTMHRQAMINGKLTVNELDIYPNAMTDWQMIGRAIATFDAMIVGHPVLCTKPLEA